jgi:hypothetical protein
MIEGFCGLFCTCMFHMCTVYCHLLFMFVCDVLFLSLAIWLLNRRVNKRELNCIEFN